MVSEQIEGAFVDLNKGKSRSNKIICVPLPESLPPQTMRWTLLRVAWRPQEGFEGRGACGSVGETTGQQEQGFHPQRCKTPEGSQ